MFIIKGRFEALMLLIIAILLLIQPSKEEEQPKNAEQNGQNYQGTQDNNFTDDYLANFLEATVNAVSTARAIGNSAEGTSQLRTSSIPYRIYECLRDFSTLRCTKMYLLRKLEQQQKTPSTDNLTKDFVQQFFGGESTEMDSLIQNPVGNISDPELNRRLVMKFQKFFKNRDLKLNLVPGVAVRIVPSKDNKLQLSFRKKVKRNDHFNKVHGRSMAMSNSPKTKEAVDEKANGLADVDAVDTDLGKRPGGGGVPVAVGVGPAAKIKHKKQNLYKNAVLQLAVPIMVMPAILMGTLLPFVLPVLKMATILTLLLNNGAFLAALVYAARVHTNAQEEQFINYGPPNY